MKSNEYFLKVHSRLASWISKRTLGGTLVIKHQQYIAISADEKGGTADHVGWMGLISVPMISAEGYSSPTAAIQRNISRFRYVIQCGLSIAHIPVSVPTSRILCGCCSFVLQSSPSRVILKMWWSKSSRSCSSSSLGKSFNGSA